MLTPTEAAWLAGFIDADGCIRLKKGMKNSKLGQNSLIPHITIHNVCLVTLARATELLSKVEIHIKLSERKRVSPSHSNMYNVEVLGMKQAEPILLALHPYLITKRLEAELLLAFIQRRKTRGVRNKPYEAVDYKAYAALKYIKKTRHLRDYVPTIQEIMDQDIVRTTARAVEEAETSSRLTKEQLKEFASKLVWRRLDRSQGALPVPK